MKIERRVGPWMTGIMALNTEMYDAYSAAYGEEKVRLIYNGVDIDQFKGADPDKIRREFGIGPDEFCVGTFARLVEGKGIPEFLQAAARACESLDNVRFFIAGGGEPGSDFEGRMHELAAGLGLADKVIFAGWRDDVRDCMAAMNLVLQVSSTYPEGMSLAPIEAMALSKPVIVTDNPGYSNVVVPGETGYIVPAGEVDELAELIVKLYRDSTLTDKLGAQAYQRVLDEFEYGIVARRIEKFYRQCLSTPGSG